MKKTHITGFIVMTFVFIFSLLCFVKGDVCAFTVVLDPGHGGEDSGAVREEKDENIEEKDLNYKIARYLKDAMEQYEDVEVFLTKEEEETMDLSERFAVAADEEADLFVSLHNNAKGEICVYDHGCTVLVSKGQYKPNLAKEEQELGACILSELSELGLENQGLLLRTSMDGNTYPNGEIADYYGLVRRGVTEGIPSVIIEHAFVDSDDYDEFLDTQDGLKELAAADARGIASYYGLKNQDTGKTPEHEKNIKTKLVWDKDGKAENNEISYKTFFKTKNQKKTRGKK